MGHDRYQFRKPSKPLYMLCSDRRFHGVVTAGDPVCQLHYHPHFDRRSHSADRERSGVAPG